ncbi:MAG: cyclic nucleotide-binding domain-containing protein [Bdellovibrionales bacterium]
MASDQAASAQNEVLMTLTQYPFFQNFGPELLAQLADVAVYRVVARGDHLLTQGQLNSNLYILLQGRLSVLVDGARVATLDKAGDLVGEMSVISHRPCSATILADTDVELYLLRADELKNKRGPDEDKIQLLLYRIYSQVLADKLDLTNQKAKRIEEMNSRLENAQEQLRHINQELELKVEERTLALKLKTEDLMNVNQKMEARNAEVVASHRKLEELYANRSSTMEHLQDLYKNHLVPLRFSLDSLVGTGDEQTRRATNEARSEIEQALQLLEPIASLYSTELAMRSKRVLLADSNKKQQINVKMALGGTGVKLDIVGSMDEARDKLDQNFDILFVDSTMLELAGAAVVKNPNTKLVLMTSEPVPKYLPDLMKLTFMPNIVSRSDEDRTFTIKNIMTTMTKLISQDLFGLEKYLAWGVEAHTSPVTHSNDRTKLIHEMEQYFESLGIRRTNRERMAVVCEELLMNAIYDAPADSSGKSLYNHLPRTVEVSLAPEHHGKFRYATDGMFCAVSVEDPFGALSGTTILKYLQSCYGGEAGTYNKQKGGAGRGLHQIVENSDLVVFNIQPGRRTEVIALFNVDPKANPIDYPTFHLFIS